jgi:hypothetical protein
MNLIFSFLQPPFRSKYYSQDPVVIQHVFIWQIKFYIDTKQVQLQAYVFMYLLLKYLALRREILYRTLASIPRI